MRARPLLLPTLTLFAAFTLACGFVTDKVAKKASDEVTEKVMEAQTGEDVEVNTSKGEFSVTTDKGTFNVQAGQNTLPAGFPSDIPLYSGAVITSSVNMQQPDGKAFILSYTVPEAPDKLSAFYKEKLSANYQSKMDANMNGQMMLMYATADEKRSVQVTVVAEGSGSQVSITAVQK